MENFRRKKPFLYHSEFDDLLPKCHSCSKRESISCEREVSKATPFTQASLQPSMASQFLGTKSKLNSRPWTPANSLIPPSFTSHSPSRQDRTYCSPSSAHFLLPSPLHLLLLLPGQPISPQSIPCWSFLPQRRHWLWQELLLDSPRSCVLP